MAEHPSLQLELSPERRADRSGVAWDAADEGPEFREYVRALVRRKWLIAAIFAGLFGATALFTFTATPMYRAETLLLIERTDPRIIDFKSVVGESLELSSSKDYYNTQYEILASRLLASDVIGQLGLERSERFLGPSSARWSWLREPLSRILQRDPAVDVPGPSDPAALIGAYLHQLDVEPILDSRLVRLYFSAADPELAARIVDAHARAYIRHGLALRARASSEAGSFLQASFDSLQDRVVKSQEALSEFRKAHGIVSLDDRADTVIASLDDMNQRLTQAQSERIAREAEMRLVRERAYETLPAVINNPLIAKLKEELAPLEREYAAISPAVTPAYSGLKALRARIDEARRRIDLEIQNIVDGIQSDYMSARRREQEVRAEVERQRTAALELKDSSVEYALLKQNVQTALNLYDSVRQRSQETGVVAELTTSNVSVIDESYPPRAPASPRKAQNLALGAFLGLAGGLGLALLLEILSQRVRTLRELERHLQIPALGVVPDLKRRTWRFGRRRRSRIRPVRRGRRGRSSVALFAPPQSARVEEAYRSIRTDILLSRPDDPPRTLLLSSAEAGEGKTTTALHTAVLFAQLGVPVLLIDADLRRPRCHELLGVPQDPGLAEALIGGPCEPRVIPLPQYQLGFLSSGACPPNPTELLGSARMRELLDKLRGQFEYILIDGPALGSVSDSLLLATCVDGVVLVADHRKARLERLRWASSRLALAYARILGVVLNRADPSICIR